ncbi:MAG TPA: hypothetical protein VHO23_02035 [Candidatus Paceibacterota bacterium]|nr:hypothetical protein [Candidatus Paceibacterota bacterium]
MSRLLPFLALLVALGLFFGYIDPTYKGSIETLRTEIRSYDDALDAADRFKEKEAQLTIARNAIPPESLARLEAFLPNGVDNVQLILDLDALAARTGMQLSDFDTAAVEDGSSPADGSIILAEEEPIDSVELTMKGVGTYAAMRAFLTATEESLRPLDLMELSVTGSDTGVYSYDMKFRLYWLR